VTFICKPPVKEKRRGGISFDGIQRRVFEKQCAFSGCHGTDNPQAGLVLTGEGVYDRIVDQLASTSAAQFAGKKLVVPGAPETSFLMDKIEGALGPGEGVQMPSGRRPLSGDTIETLRKWILAGAPRDRVLTGGVAGELDVQPRIPAPAPPAGGFQAHMTSFPLADRPETEGCQMVRLGNPRRSTSAVGALHARGAITSSAGQSLPRRRRTARTTVTSWTSDAVFRPGFARRASRFAPAGLHGGRADAAPPGRLPDRRDRRRSGSGRTSCR
jgi:hypothetical protein